jgi:hypothetical protein
MIEGIIEVILSKAFVIPGAFIRWAFKGFRDSWKYVRQENEYVDSAIGTLLILSIIVWIIYLINPQIIFNI